MIRSKLVLFQLMAVISMLLVSCNSKEGLFKIMIGNELRGTGFIVAKDSSNYYVLTAKHTIDIKPNQSSIVMPDDLDKEEKLKGENKSAPYRLVDADNTKYTIDYDKNIFKESTLDLAIIKLNIPKDKSYSVAVLSQGIEKGQNVSIRGFKNCPDADPKRDPIEANKGVIEKLYKEDTKGYGVIYSNLTIGGMSGSPISDDSGKIIAIHGHRGNSNVNDGQGKNLDTKVCEIPSEYTPNVGISMKVFLNSELAKKVPISQ